jgi:hypothetical protein
MIFLGIFPWAKERVGETTSNRIEIERRFFDIMKFLFQCLKDNAQLITLSVGNFCSRMTELRFPKIPPFQRPVNFDNPLILARSDERM